MKAEYLRAISELLEKCDSISMLDFIWNLLKRNALIDLYQQVPIDQNKVIND